MSSGVPDEGSAREGIYRGPRRTSDPPNDRTAVAAVLSFVWPGLGDAYTKHPRRALILALPPAALVLGLAALILRDPAGFALNLLVPAFAFGMIFLIAAHGAWRVLAIIEIWIRRRHGRSKFPLAALVTLLVAVVAVVHIAGAAYVQSFSDSARIIFTGDRPSGPSEIDDILGGTGGTIPDDTEDVGGDTNGGAVDPDNASPGPSFDPSLLPPSLSPPPADESNPVLPAAGPINVLFIGIDSGLGRDHALTDSLIVASYWPEHDTISMVSIPRDTGRIPLYTGGTRVNRINTFLGYARANPELFPEGPIAALMRELGYLLGIDIPYYAATDLDGMPAAVDAVGGVDVTLDKPIADSHWNLYLQPGAYHLDGTTVMPYVRSRYGPNNSDWERARRQQQVIVALAKRVEDPSVAIRLPQVINAISQVVRTNVPRDQVDSLLQIVERANDASTEHIVLSPNTYARRVPPDEVDGRYMTELNIAAIRELSVRLYGPYSRYE